MTTVSVKKPLDVNIEINVDADRYCFDPKRYLEMFKAHQTCEQFTDEKLGYYLIGLEQYLYHFAGQLGGDNYNGGYWTMDKGFFLLSDGESDKTFDVSDFYGSTSKVNVTEFSIICNLFALSHLSIASLENKNPFTNHLSVFLSDYIKSVMSHNREILNTSEIYKILD